MERREVGGRDAEGATATYDAGDTGGCDGRKKVQTAVDLRGQVTTGGARHRMTLLLQKKTGAQETAGAVVLYLYRMSDFLPQWPLGNTCYVPMRRNWPANCSIPIRGKQRPVAALYLKVWGHNPAMTIIRYNAPIVTSRGAGLSCY